MYIVVVNSIIENSYSITFFIRTHAFDRYVVRCDSKNGFQKDMSLKEIGLGAQNTITILESIVNIIVGTYMTI